MSLMKCPKCKIVKKGVKFCGECGTKLQQFADSDGIWKPEGLWKITTSADEEGRMPPRNLGVHEGHIVDLARQFSSEASYSLEFAPADSLELVKRSEPRQSVHVSLDSDTRSMKAEERLKYFRAMIKDRSDVKIHSSNYYGCVLFNFVPPAAIGATTKVVR